MVTDQSPGAGSSTCSRGRPEARRGDSITNFLIIAEIPHALKSFLIFTAIKTVCPQLFEGNILDIVTIMQALLSSVFPKLRLSLEVASHIVEMCNLGT